MKLVGRKFISEVCNPELHHM